MNWAGILGAIAAALAVGFASKKVMAAVPEASGVNWFTVYDPMFKKYGAQKNVPWRWLKATAMKESSLGRDPLLKTARGSIDGKSRGLMQVTLSTFQWVNSNWHLGYQGVSEELDNPEISVHVAAVYMRWLMDQFPGNREYTIRAYNGGPGFRFTEAGLRDTPAYYRKWSELLAEVMEKQPGNELERS